MTTSSQLAEFLEFAHHLADLSGHAIRPHFRRPLKVANKADGRRFDPVTVADRAAERAIARALRQRWPDHGLIGEEYGTRPGTSRYRWVVDPIDGTRAFVLGLPVWGTLIGLLDGDAPVLGLMDQPYTGERFWAGETGSHFKGPDGRKGRLKTRVCARLADAMLCSTSPDLFNPGGERKGFAALKDRVRACRFGGDCYGYCLLAAGHIDLIVETGLKPHDIVALIPIIERAGGRITTWDNGPAAAGGQIVAAGDARVHGQALKVLARGAA